MIRTERFKRQENLPSTSSTLSSCNRGRLKCTVFVFAIMKNNCTVILVLYTCTCIDMMYVVCTHNEYKDVYS